MPAEMYCHQLYEIHIKLSKIRPVLVNRRRSFQLNKNARPNFVTDLGYDTLPHPLYYADVSPTEKCHDAYSSIMTYFKPKIFRRIENAEIAFKYFLVFKALETGRNEMAKMYRYPRFLLITDSNVV